MPTTEVDEDEPTSQPNKPYEPLNGQLVLLVNHSGNEMFFYLNFFSQTQGV